MLYLNTTIFKEKIMKYQRVFVTCRKREGIIKLKNFTFPQKEMWSSLSWTTIKQGTFVILPWHPTSSRKEGGW